jgi:DNA-binding NarL/FixJ family response regulator
MAGPTDSADRGSRQEVPRIVVAVAHPTMRRYLCDLIEQNCRCWLATTSSDPDELQAALGRLCPDVLVVDHALRPVNGNRRQAAFPAAQVLVIGPEPDSAYREAAIDGGAGAWLSRDDLETELVPELARMLADCGCGCGCEPPR